MQDGLRTQLLDIASRMPLDAVGLPSYRIAALELSDAPLVVGAKQPSTIFSYVNTYRQIQIGTEITGVVVRMQPEGGINNEDNTKPKQTNSSSSVPSSSSQEANLSGATPSSVNMLYEIILKENHKARMGVTSDADNYENYNFKSLEGVVLHCAEFYNNGIVADILKGHHLIQYQPLERSNNFAHLRALNLQYDRIRDRQEQDWAAQHFREGLKLLKSGKNTEALQFLTVAKNFNPRNANICVAKGCAYANMKNFSDGLKQVSEALSIDPHNRQALQYDAAIRRQAKSHTQGRKKVKTQSQSIQKDK